MKTARRFREPASALALVLLVAAAGCADSAAPSRRATDDSADFDRSGTHHVKTVNVTFDANPVSHKSSTMAHAVAKDASGRVLTDKSVTWRSQNQNVAMVSRDGLVTPQRQGTSTIQATIEGVTGDAPLSVIDSLPVGTDSVTALSITRQPSAAAQSGVAFAVQPVIQLRGVLNTPVRRAGVVVSAAVASGDGMVMGTTSATTNSDGVATFTGLGIRGPVGSYTVRFSASGASVTSDAIALSAGPASQLAITTQPSATAASGSAFARQPVVQAQDDVGNPASQSGVVVSVALASGTGTLGGPAAATTNASGVASFTGLSITGSGAYTLRFSASGLTGATSSTITVTQTAAALVVQTQPGGATSGTPFTQQPVVRIVDNAGQVVSGSTLAVTAAVTSGSGTLSGTTTVSAVNGVATFTNLQINGAGTDVLTFSTTNPALQVASNSFTVGAATPVATQLVLTRQPAGATSGSAFTTQPVVEVRDGNNARVSSSTAAVTAAVASGSGTLSGTTTVSAVNGVATFTNLTITGSGAHTLVFRSTGLTSATSSSFTVASSGGGGGSTAPSNECASPGAGWIFCDDFESNRLSSYFEYDNAGGKFVRTSSAGLNGSVGMRATFTSGQTSAGNLKLAFGRTPDAYFRAVDAGTANYREVYWRFYVRREPGWVGNGPGKLTRAIVFANSNWAEAMAAHAWTDDADTRYLKLDPASGTDANGNLMATGYNDFSNWRWLGAARSALPEEDQAHVGQWACYEFHVKLNTAGQSNGLFEFWVNGQLSAQRASLNWVGSYNAYGINAVFLEQYGDPAPAANVRTIDNFVVSTQPIGCGY